MSSFSTILHAFVTPLTRVVTSIPEWAKSEHIKTVGGQSILGEGDIPLSGVTLDDTVTQTSQNGVKSSGIWTFVHGYQHKGDDEYYKSYVADGVQHYVKMVMVHDEDIGWGAEWTGDYILVDGEFIPYSEE